MGKYIRVTEYKNEHDRKAAETRVKKQLEKFAAKDFRCKNPRCNKLLEYHQRFQECCSFSCAGTFRNRDWSFEDLELLRILYPITEDWDELLEIFPTKSKVSIRNQGGKVLGLRKLRLKNYPPSCNDNFFSEFKQEQAYVLGFIEADGYKVSRPTSHRTFMLQIHLSDEDERHLIKIKNTLSVTSEIRHNANPTSKDHDSVMMTCSSRIWKKDLEDKYRIGRIPNFIKEDSELIRHYIRGYFDGDGSIYQPEEFLHLNRINFVFSSESLAQDFKNTIKNELQLEGSITINQKTNSEKCWYFQISTQDEIDKFYKWIYNNSVIHLDRKKNKFV